tara:strand:- start:5147 stop:5485 length:339 start_codon:yes stop_codon:yes gene_type:complete
MQLMRSFLKDGLGIDVPEGVCIIPDVEFSLSQALPMEMQLREGGNPFLIDPSLVQKMLDSGQYTFTWYTSVDDDITERATPPIAGELVDVKLKSGWTTQDDDDDEDSDPTLN